MRKSFRILPILFVGLLGGKFASATSICNGSTNNLVANCSFQTGTFANWTGTTTTDPNNAYAYDANGIDTGDPLAAAGSQTPYGGQAYEAYHGSIGYTDTLTQALTTVVGTDYTIEFALLNDTSYGAPYPNLFDATFGAATLLSESDVLSDGYTLYSFTEVATSTTTDLSFTTENGSGDFELDSISVTPAVAATPEPGSIVLLCTGILGLAGIARRRLIA